MKNEKIIEEEKTIKRNRMSEGIEDENEQNKDTKMIKQA